jgi:serine/threonine protein kinase
MELCELGSLDAHMATNQLTPKQKLKISHGVALGIRHLHNNNVIHRDIACRNVLLSEGMKAKVSDFGMSRLVEQFEKQGTTNTSVGPIRFMAPESLSAGSAFSEKSDVWMFCCFLVELWTGKSPHHDKNLIDGTFWNFWFLNRKVSLTKFIFPSWTFDSRHWLVSRVTR